MGCVLTCHCSQYFVCFMPPLILVLLAKLRASFILVPCWVFGFLCLIGDLGCSVSSFAFFFSDDSLCHFLCLAVICFLCLAVI